MWRTLTNIFGLSKETNNGDDADDDDEEEEQVEMDEGDASRISQPVPVDELREFVGTVTSLHSAYGLIDHEICFTMEAVNGVMPKLGDRVHVVSSRKNAVGGWRAKRVWLVADDEFACEAKMTQVANGTSVHVDSMTSSSSSSGAKHPELLENKDGVVVTECADFGNMQLGEAASLTIAIRCSRSFNTTGTMAYLDLFPHKLLLLTYAADVEGCYNVFVIAFELTR